MTFGGLGMRLNTPPSSPQLKSSGSSRPFATQILGGPQFGQSNAVDGFKPMARPIARPAKREGSLNKLVSMVMNMATVGGKFSLNPPPEGGPQN